MPEEVSAQLEAVAPGGVVQLGNAPASLDDGMFDSLFPAEPTVQSAPAQPVQTQQQVAATPAQTPTQTPVTQTPVASDFFLQGQVSKYKTADAAVEGINAKDALIEQLRQRFALTTGVDPITNQPVGQVQQQQQAVQQTDYSQNAELYVKDLTEAANRNDPKAYRDIQVKLLMDTFKPLQPVIQNAAREQASQQFLAQVPAAKEFLGSSAYSKALEASPELAEAISICEREPSQAARLPGLYKLAHLTAQGIAAPDLLRAQQTVQQTAPQNTPTTQVVRTTMAPTTQSIPQKVASPTLRTLEGIRATIAEAEARGVSMNF